MSKRSYLPQSDGDKQNWLTNFANKINTYKGKYSLAGTEVTDMQNSSAAYTYWLNYLNQYKEYLGKLTEYKNELRDGVAPGSAASLEPTPPTMGAAPTAVNPGIFTRATSLVLRIKAHNDYTLADGKDLGLEGEEVTDDDLSTIKPIIQVRLVNGGFPEIVWKKKSTDGIDIYVDRGTGNFIFLATDTVPNYTDTFSLPSGAAVWRYRCIYRVDDAQVGQWSDIVSVTVTGV